MKQTIKSIIRTILDQIYRIVPFKYDKVIWLIGSGRSGTTWVSALINHDKSFRELFEPFHPWLPGTSFMQLHKYLQANEQHKKLENVSKLVFRGSFYQSRVEAANSTWRTLSGGYRHLLVKDIFTNLMAYNLSQKHPKVKTVLLIRNPFAVAISKQERKHWLWMNDPADFLNNINLVRDYLDPYKQIIEDVSAKGSHLDKLITVWCLINYVPLRQFPQENLLVTFYEDWIIDPQRELQRLQSYAGFSNTSKISLVEHKVYSEASHTSQNKSFDPNAWKTKISDKQYESAMHILRVFGFDELYDPNSKPDHSVIQRVRRTSKELPQGKDNNSVDFPITG